MTNDDGCEFCQGREHARKGGAVTDNPYEGDKPKTLLELSSATLWQEGFLVGDYERKLQEDRS